MLMLIIAEMSSRGAKYHQKQIDKYRETKKEYSYHVYMMKLYTDILELTLESHKLRDKYLE